MHNTESLIPNTLLMYVVCTFVVHKPHLLQGQLNTNFNAANLLHQSITTGQGHTKVISNTEDKISQLQFEFQRSLNKVDK